MAHSRLVLLTGCLVCVICFPMGPGTASAEPPAEKTPSLESRLRDLEYPELRKRSAEEIAVIKELVSSTDRAFKRAEALYRSGARGGTIENRELAGLHVALAKAEQAWAEGRPADAYSYTRQAVQFASRHTEAVFTAYEVGTTTFESVCNSQVRLAETKLRLIRAEKVAKAAGVDLTKLKPHEARRDEKDKTGAAEN